MSHFDLTVHNEIFNKPDRIKEPVSWAGHIPFVFFLVNLIRPDLIVELGVHTGNSYNVFCQAVKDMHLETRCYGIDTWEGDEHAGYYGEDIYNELLQYQQKKYREFSSLLKMTFDQALHNFSDQSIDILHIDGCHTYGAVKHDFQAWLPKVSAGGVILLHDICVREKDFGVWRLWEEIKESYPTIEFNHSHGLGIMFNGVHSENVRAFLEQFRTNSFYRVMFESIGEKPLLFMEIEQKSKEIKELNRNLKEQASHIELQNQTINNQVAESERKDHLIEQYNQAIKNKDEHLEELSQAVEYKDNLIKEVINSSSWKITAPLRHLGLMARKLLKRV